MEKSSSTEEIRSPTAFLHPIELLQLLQNLLQTMDEE